MKTYIYRLILSEIILDDIKCLRSIPKLFMLIQERGWYIIALEEFNDSDFIVLSDSARPRWIRHNWTTEVEISEEEIHDSGGLNFSKAFINTYLISDKLYCSPEKDYIGITRWSNYVATALNTKLSRMWR